MLAMKESLWESMLNLVKDLPMMFKCYYVCNYGFMKNTLLPLLVFHCDNTKIYAVNKLSVNRGTSLN